jgi:hypothetical protein
MSGHLDQLQRLMQEITQLTTNIATNYPELYLHLEENPMTIPNDPHPEVMDVGTLCRYLTSLKAQLRHHIENHRIRS